MRGKGRPKAAAWRNRIVGEADVAPDQLLANPLNWRIHPQHQQDALGQVLGAVGWVQRVVVNRRTGYVVDGHIRVQLAIGRNEPTVPVVYVDLSEAEEALVLAVLDPIAALAVPDETKKLELQELIPEDLQEVVAIAWGDPAERTTVEFEAKVRHTVVVDCDSEHAQHALAERLRGEGYAVKVRG